MKEANRVNAHLIPLHMWSVLIRTVCDKTEEICQTTDSKRQTKLFFLNKTRRGTANTRRLLLSVASNTQNSRRIESHEQILHEVSALRDRQNTMTSVYWRTQHFTRVSNRSLLTRKWRYCKTCASKTKEYQHKLILFPKECKECFRANTTCTLLYNEAQCSMTVAVQFDIRNTQVPWHGKMSCSILWMSVTYAEIPYAMISCLPRESARINRIRLGTNNIYK